MERESPCSCRSTCEKDELSPALGQRPQPGCAKPLLGSTLDPPPVRTGARDSSGLGSTLTCHRSGQVTTGGPCTPGPPPPWGPGSIPSHAQQQQQLPQHWQGQAGTHGAAHCTLSLGALGQLGATAPVLAEQSLHAVDDVPDTADEALPLRLEDELIVDLRVERPLNTQPSQAAPTFTLTLLSPWRLQFPPGCPRPGRT